MRNLLAILAFSLVTGATQAAAQTTETPISHNDAAMSLGWFGAVYPHEDPYGNGWHPSLFAGVSVGHYWTDHLKTEVEAAWLSRVRSYEYETLVIGRDTAYVTSEYQFRTLELSVDQSYQFGRNAWIHPFVAAGADIDSLRTVEDQPAPGRPPYLSNGAPATAIPTVHEAESSLHVHPFVKAGFKKYLTENAFFLSEWKFGFGDGLQHVVWKSGFGVDF